MSDLRHRVQVCVPFTRLREELLDHFTCHRLNPEIGIDAAAIERCSPQDFARVAVCCIGIASPSPCMRRSWICPPGPPILPSAPSLAGASTNS